MASDYDPTEFVDGDFQAHKQPASAALPVAAAAVRAPSREEIDSKVTEAHQKLAELKRVQEELERERAGLEETRRRQMEFQTGRQEMVQHLTRGIGLLEEAEFNARREAEQMAKSLGDLRDALTKVQGVREETWNQDNFSVELTRALTTLENARMEWNAARLKFPQLATQAATSDPTAEAQRPPPSLLDSYTFGDLCRIGFALTWPVAAVALVLAIVLVALLLR